jgi:hypothetical protein
MAYTMVGLVSENRLMRRLAAAVTAMRADQAHKARSANWHERFLCAAGGVAHYRAERQASAPAQ